ncbi:MAG TPA: penicillin acylase family protein, partial [Roseateles sp.]|uniref:penicillin acylase family protein n=1 Tax=Roseateles sp. TaxID=1971397 RepID=UPI002ED9250E
MRRPALRASSLAVLASLIAPLTALAVDGKPVYQAQVQRTSFGIPHIQATDWGSLGYGYGYAFAQDNVCVLAREVLAASGTQSLYFGASTVASDRVYKLTNSAARVDAAWRVIDEETRDLLTGYADGFNRYLRDTGPGALPADCRAQPWVQPITGKDALKVLRKLLVRAGTGNFIAGLNAAVPPAAVGAAAAPGADVAVAAAAPAPSLSHALAA